MPSARTRPTVTIVTRPLWRMRLARELPRYLLCGLSVAGLAASARFAIAPPRPLAPVALARAPVAPDLAAEGYAVLFARRYLTWDAADPEESQRALESFGGPGMEADAGLQLPASGEQRVEWAEVVQAREPAPSEHVYTVAAQTDTAALEYLTVSVVRKGDGSLALVGYPAFVGAPASSPAQASGRMREVDDPALATVVERALRNYLAGSESELAADLAADARVSLPSPALSLQSVQRLDWSPGAGAVLAVVQARDGRGVQYTLAYELDVAQTQGRWEVSAVQMDPDT
jgi:Conjugative transposon protein TcpC